MPQAVVFERNLASLEDLNFGTGTEIQSRNGVDVEVTLINAQNMPFDVTRNLAEALTAAEADLNIQALGLDLRTTGYTISVAGELIAIATVASELGVGGDITTVAGMEANITEILVTETKTAILNAAANALAAQAARVGAEAAEAATIITKDLSAQHAGQAQSHKWEAEAFKLTANSYATEPEDTYVKIYTSNGDSTFTITNSTEFSSLHWASKSEALITGTGVVYESIEQTLAEKTIKVKTSYLIGGASHIDDLNKILNHQYSAGVMHSGEITDNGNGSVNIAAAEAMLRATGATSHDQLYSVLVPAQTNIALTDNTVNYVCVQHNSGTPTLTVITDTTLINMLDTVPMYIITREGTSLNILDVREQNVDHIAKAQLKEFYTKAFVRKDGGAIIGDAGTLHINCTAGAFYFQLNEYPIAALDTTGTDTFEYYKHVAGAWIETNASILDNAYYDDGTDLVAIGANKYGTHWVYGIMGSNPHYAVLYGNAEYNTLAAAQIATAPSSVPPSVLGTGVLLGRIITQEGDGEIQAVATSFTENFNSSLATIHNNLAGLQGGTTDQYYHLTLAEHTELLAVASDNYKATELDAGQLDNRYYTETEIDAAVADRRKLYAKETLPRNIIVADITATKLILTAAENLYGRFDITDTSVLLSAEFEVVIDASIRDFIVKNSTLQNLKVWIGSGGFIIVPAGEIYHLYCDSVNVIDFLSFVARLVSPAFTGIPTAPTPASETNTTQLATTAFAYGTVSKSANGYVKFPNGTIVQWGRVLVPVGGIVIGFNIVFPNVCGAAAVLVENPANPTSIYVSITGQASTGNMGITTNNIASNVNWIAIGY